MTDFDKIKEIAMQNNGLFKTNQLVAYGIRKERLKEWLEEKRIIRMERGMYALKDSFIDRFYEFQMRYPKVVYSYATAAYIWGLFDKPLEYMECTLPRGTNATHIKSRFHVRYHFVPEEQYQIGLVKDKSPFGTEIVLYDRERVVCDFIRHKSRCDIQIWGTVLNNYFRGRNKDLKKLIRYAKNFGIIDELEMYVELLQ